MANLNYPYKDTFRQALKPLAITFIIILSIWLAKGSIYAEDCERIENNEDREKCFEYQEKMEEKEEEHQSTSKELEKLSGELEDISGEISELASQISIKQSSIDELQAKIDRLKEQIQEINENLEDRKATLEKKETLRNAAIRNLSKKSLLTEWEKFIGSSSDLSSLDGFEYATFTYIFDRALSKDSLNWIKVLTEEILGFEANKAEAFKLKEEISRAQTSLISLKNQMDRQKAEAEEVKGALTEEQEEKTEKLLSLEEEIAKLSAKQKAILEQKYGGGTISGYDAPEYKLPSCPFDKGFALMSYGAFTHRYGMSQFGAKGRAEDGQDYKEIIKFYYGEKIKEKDDFPKKIKVQGYREMDFQKYLYGLAEMLSSWPKETLKAQAVAARSYAYRTMQGSAYREDGGICTSDSCQVFLESKVNDSRAERWHEAVDDTKNEIIGGSMDKIGYGWYSSTTGGWIHNVGWDGDWPNGAYEKKAKSPWFYKAWYNYPLEPNSSDTCGRSTPWLSEKEMADILNAWVVWKKGKDSDIDNITPITTSCWGGDPYSMDKMADKAEDYDGKFTKIHGVKVSNFSSGKTGKVCFDTNRGSNNPCIDGQEFAVIANLRAPGYISIRTDWKYLRYFLFDIEVDD